MTAPDLRPRVLIVDDQELAVAEAAAIVGGLACEVIPTTDAEAALALIRDKEFNLVLTDIRMPGMDGIELARRVRGLGRSGPRLVAMSAHLAPQEILSLREHGFSHFIAKPLHADEVRVVVAALLGIKVPPPTIGC